VIILLIILACAIFLLGYVYVGYPLLVGVLAKLFPNPPKKSDITPLVSVVIPAFNEAQVIAKKIDNTIAFDYPRDKMQIIVSDDGSTDNTAEIVRGYADRGIELVTGNTRSGKIGAMNRAYQHANGEIIVFTDADIICEASALAEEIANFADEAVGCVTGGHRIVQAGADKKGVGSSNDFYWRYESFIKKSESIVSSCVAGSGHLLSVRKNLVEDLPHNIVLDDFYRVLTVLRQGYRVIYEPRSVCYQLPVVSMQDEVMRRRRMIGGRYQIIWMSRQVFPHFKLMDQLMVISHKFLRLLIPLLMILALVSNALVFIWMRDLQQTVWLWYLVLGLMLAQTSFYLIAVLAAVLDSSAVKIPKLFKIPLFLVSTNFGVLQGLFWFLSGSQTVLWQQPRRE